MRQNCSAENIINDVDKWPGNSRPLLGRLDGDYLTSGDLLYAFQHQQYQGDLPPLIIPNNGYRISKPSPACRTKHP